MIVNYDDSDGWYDHVYSGVTNPSLSPADNLTNTDVQRGPDLGPVRPEPADHGAARGRAGPLRLRPAAPDARDLAVRKREPRRPRPDNQASIINFIEYNWHLPGIPGSADQVLSKLDRSQGSGVRPCRDVRLQASKRRGVAPQSVDGRARSRASPPPEVAPDPTLIRGGRGLRVPAASLARVDASLARVGRLAGSRRPPRWLAWTPRGAALGGQPHTRPGAGGECGFSHLPCG